MSANIQLPNQNCYWLEQYTLYYQDKAIYKTSCGEYVDFSEGLLKDSNYKYCPYCQKEIVDFYDLFNEIFSDTQNRENESV